jgi:hypothetical protein
MISAKFLFYIIPPRLFMKKLFYILLIPFISCNSVTSTKNEKETTRIHPNSYTKRGLHGKAKKMIFVCYFDIYQEHGDWLPKDNAYGFIQIAAFNPSGNITELAKTSLQPGDTTFFRSSYEGNKYIGTTIWQSGKNMGESKTQWQNDSTQIETFYNATGKMAWEIKYVYNENGNITFNGETRYNSAGAPERNILSYYQYNNDNSVRSSITTNINNSGSKTDTLDREILSKDKFGNILKQIARNHTDRKPSHLEIYSYEYY